MIMKIHILALATVFTMAWGSCSDSTNETNISVTDSSTGIEKENWTDSVARFRESARLGDGHAYLSLAKCYSQGKGVDMDFLLTWQMAKMAVQYNGISSVDEFFDSLPEDSHFRLLIDAIGDFNFQHYDEALQKADLLAEHFPADASLIRAAVALEEGKREKALSLLDEAAAHGNLLAAIAVSIVNEGEEAIYRYAEQMPTLYCRMARESFTTDIDPAEDEMAAALYRKADKHLCLDSTGVRWLLSYYEYNMKNGRYMVDNSELERLRLLNSRLAHQQTRDELK